ncbi:MAG: TolC family protein [Desulfobacteraceae bacterium]|nr:TolC family protein [Desulfobacteraceae bacterium]
MSVNLTRLAVTILAASFFIPAAARAFDLAYPLADPLHTEPAELREGVVLPGDREPVPCAVRQDFSRPLALGEAVDLALCNNPQIKASWADIRVQAGALGEARAAYLPTLNGALSRTNDRIHYSDSRYLSTSQDSNTAQATLDWRLFDFGARAANRKAAEDLLAAALATHQATLQRALTGVVQAYFDAISGRAAVEAKREGEEIARETLRSAQKRELKGVGTQSDTLQAATALAKAQLDKNRAQGDYQKALAVLAYILAVPDNTIILLPEERDEDIHDQALALGQWLNEAQRKHPAVLAARKQLAAAQQRVTATRAAGLPNLSFSTSFYQNTRPGEAVTSTDATETTFGLSISVPLFDGFTQTYKLRGAQAQVEQKRANLSDTEHQIAMEVIKAHADATSALHNLEAAANLLFAAQEALTVTKRKYDKAAADIMQLLSVQAALADARQERIRSLADWRSARLRLMSSAGQLGRSAIGEQ